MDLPHDRTPPRSGDFRLADYLVEPRLNRIRRTDDDVHVEPRVMDLLVLLASRRGDVVSKEELVEAVWEGRFITDWALTRTIADLRRALGDEARNPRFIATISKRGYRLIAPVEWQDATPASTAEAPPGLTGPGPLFALTWRGRTLPLSEGEHVLGRSPDGVACISSPKVSRRHARITVSGRGAMLEDLGSKNGTYLNGRRLERPAELVDGDAIGVGPARLVFRAFVPDGSTETELGLRLAD